MLRREKEVGNGNVGRKGNRHMLKLIMTMIMKIIMMLMVLIMIRMMKLNYEDNDDDYYI